MPSAELQCFQEPGQQQRSARAHRRSQRLWGVRSLLANYKNLCRGFETHVVFVTPEVFRHD